MSKLIYVHGTNGSGKSTLARALLQAVGGAKGMEDGVTLTQRAGFVMIGKYVTACGGVDTVHPYARVKEIIKEQAGKNRVIFAEGLITPGLQTCKDFAQMVDEALFIYLDVPVKVCVEHVKQRRHEAGNFDYFDISNLVLKARSALSWANRLPAEKLSYDEAYAFCLKEIMS